MWINQNFLFESELEFSNELNFKVIFKCLRDNTDLWMNFEMTGKVIFYTDNLSLAADLVQSLASFLNLDTLEVI